MIHIPTSHTATASLPRLLFYLYDRHATFAYVCLRFYFYFLSFFFTGGMEVATIIEEVTAIGYNH